MSGVHCAVRSSEDVMNECKYISSFTIAIHIRCRISLCLSLSREMTIDNFTERCRDEDIAAQQPFIVRLYRNLNNSFEIPLMRKSHRTSKQIGNWTHFPFSVGRCRVICWIKFKYHNHTVQSPRSFSSRPFQPYWYRMATKLWLKSRYDAKIAYIHRTSHAASAVPRKSTIIRKSSSSPGIVCSILLSKTEFNSFFGVRAMVTLQWMARHPYAFRLSSEYPMLAKCTRRKRARESVYFIMVKFPYSIIVSWLAVVLLLLLSPSNIHALCLRDHSTIHCTLCGHEFEFIIKYNRFCLIQMKKKKAQETTATSIGIAFSALWMPWLSSSHRMYPIRAVHLIFKWTWSGSSMRRYAQMLQRGNIAPSCSRCADDWISFHRYGSCAHAYSCSVPFSNFKNWETSAHKYTSNDNRINNR